MSFPTGTAARRGFAVLAVEPSAEMAAIAARRCASYPHVAVMVSTFEDFEVEPAGFDVVMSAQAWHWVSRHVRHRKARAALRPAGTLALLWTHPRWDQCAVTEDLVEVYDRFAPELTGCGPWFPGFTDEAGAERPTTVELAGLFGPITEHRYPWTESYEARRYIDLVRSLVEHERLPTERLDRLVEAIAQIIKAAGGTIDVSYQTRLYLTRAIAP